MGKQINQLKPTVNETSLVGRGSQKQRFLLRKEDSMDLEAIMKTVLEGKVDGEEALDALLAKADLTDEEMTRVRSAVRLLDSVRDKLPDDVMQSLGKITGAAKSGHLDEEDEDKKKAAEAEKTAKAAKEAQVDKKDEILKADGSINLDAVPENMRPVIATLAKGIEVKDAIIEKQTEQLTKLADKTEALISEQRMDKLTKEAESTLRHLPGTAVEKAEVLKGIEALDPELQKRVGNLLKQADTAFKQNALFSEVGTGGSGSGAGTAYHALLGKAEEIQKADSKLSQAAAFDKAVSQNAALYNQYQQERNGRH